MSAKSSKPKAKILLVEGKRSDHQSFAFGLDKKGYLVDSVPNGSSALAHLENSLPDIIIIDAASMRTSGRRICQSVHRHATDVPIILVIDQNIELVDKNGADVTLMLPFTLQKLINRMRPLLPVEPKDVLQVGPFQLDVNQRIARCLTRQARLTPRLVLLLKILMKTPGVVIEREALFRQVWDTEYTGDTRTLDVHISWLRQALEEDPRRPRFIKTVRGLGYRLDLDEEVPSIAAI